MKVFLVGMMGSGKTTLGKILAERLGTCFYDSDEMITQSESTTVVQIFEQEGEAYFRNLESNWIDEIIPLDGVFATGGGLPCFNDNISQMNKIGTTIFLETTVDTILERIKDDNTRPILNGKSSLEKAEVLKNMLDKRIIHYKKSKYIINCEKTQSLIADDIESILKSENQQ